MGIPRHWRKGISVSIVLLLLAGVIGNGLAGIVHGTEEAGPRCPPEREQLRPVTLSRRLLIIVPGSSPPTCRARCGWCFPCQPVHVAVQPGRSIPLEYYPEAWRCKCRNKLFMP